MSDESDILKATTKSLLDREQEVLSLRARQEKLAAWLSVAQVLPGIVDGEKPIEEILSQAAEAVAAATGMQRVLFFYRLVDALRPIGAGADAGQSLSAEAITLLQAKESGLCNRAASGVDQGLSRAVGLSRFLWLRIDVAGLAPLLVAAGFESQTADARDLFDKSDLDHLVGMGQQLSLLLKNRILRGELERKSQLLAEMNEALEERVAARSTESARANREISRALALLREKDSLLKADLEQARSFQQTLLPVLPASRHVEFDALYRPLDLVGGDIFDVFEVQPDLYRIFIADATGHGVQASLRTIVLKSEYDQLKASYREPRALLNALNRRLLIRHRTGDMLCTACCIDIDARRGVELRHASAGHPAPIHAWADGFAPLHLDSPLMGASAEVDFPQAETTLAPNDWLIAYTDGISEQMANGQVFSLENAIVSALRCTGTTTPLLRRVLDDFIRFLGPIPVEDDIALIAVHVLPAAARNRKCRPIPDSR